MSHGNGVVYDAGTVYRPGDATTHKQRMRDVSRVGRLTALPERPIGRNLRAIVLYGSKVRGDFTQESDLDVPLLVQRLGGGSRRK